MKNVFVYGTLLRGEPNHALLKGARFVCNARTPAAFTLVSLGGFPGMLQGGSTAVHGEVWRVDARTLARLDQLEGHPSFYHRVRIALDSVADVEAYVLPERYRTHDAIASGSWRAHRQEGQRCGSP